MAFFVLSGYFFARSILQKINTERWSWIDYSIDRLSRLYIVLIPALLLTLLLDVIGLDVNPQHFVYMGGDRPWIHDCFSVADRLGPGQLLGNLAFLQSIIVPPFGSNVALWSLSFEFWYYAAFPCIAVILFSSTITIKGRLAAMVSLLAIIDVMSPTIRFYAFIWLLGASVAYLEQRTSLNLSRGVSIVGSRVAAIVTVMVVVGLHLPLVEKPINSLVAGLPSFGLIFGDATLVKDYLIGISVAIWIFFLTNRPATNRVWVPYQAIAVRLASFSYTLYLVHLPILVFCRSWTAERPWTLNGLSFAGAVVLTILCVAAAFAIASVTEYRTGDVRRAVRGLLARWLPAIRLDFPVAAATEAKPAQKLTSRNSHHDN